jgi:uncharacterized protein (DUF362 family)
MLIVTYGDDIVKNTIDTLKTSDITAYLDPGAEVSIKPNLVVPGPASNGAVTHPEIVEGIILFLKDFGVRKMKIIESSWTGDSTIRAFKYCGYTELSGKYNVPLIDLKGDTFRKHSFGGYDIDVCDESMNAGFLINVPVLKAHCQTRFTCCMKNLKGCIPDSEKRRFHTLGIHKPVAALNGIIKTGYCVVDGICGDLSFEEGGNPVVSNRIVAGRDPLMVDSYCVELIGYSPDEIGYISHGEKLGVGKRFTHEVKLVEINPDSIPVNARSDLISDKYRRLIVEDAACSACYSSLIYALHRLGGKTRATGKFHIGQGFRGKGGDDFEKDAFGIGDCAGGCRRFVPGCPPKATGIISGIRD